jgi:hypothetical protein
MKFTKSLDLLRQPVQNLVPESSGTAPSTPVSGQLWVDTTTTPHTVKKYNATSSSWDPWLLLGTGAGTAQQAGLALLIANNLSDLNNATTARTNLGLGTAATKNIPASGNASATEVVYGSDTRLADTRTPSALSVVDSMVSASAAIAESKLALASDAAAGTASRRTLGYTGTSAMPGIARLDQIAAPTASVAMGSQRITGLAPSSAGTDAVNRNELDAARQGYAGAKDPVRVAAPTNVNLTTPGATIDGVTMAVNDRFLAPNQTTALENGIYVFNGSAAAATRATDADAAGEVKDGTTVAVAAGTGAGTVYIQTASVDTTAPGVTTAQTWVLYSTQATYTGTAARITVTGTVIDIASTYVGQTSITTLGTITTGTWTATAIGLAYGGTGTDASTTGGKTTARSNLGAGQAGYQALIASALVAGTPLTITHNLNTDKCIAQVRDATTGEYVGMDIIDAPSTPNTLTVTSGIAYAANTFDIVVIPI